VNYEGGNGTGGGGGKRCHVVDKGGAMNKTGSMEESGIRSDTVFCDKTDGVQEFA